MKLVTKERATELVARGLRDLGYQRVSHGHGTKYYSKVGTYWKIRISNHPDLGQNHDVCHDVVLDGPTIMSDIDHRIKKADEAFERKTRKRFGS